MEGDGLGNWMVRRAVLDREGLRRALQRQSVYAGALDTVVLELGLSDEAGVGACLAEATGLPAPSPAWLESPARDLAGLLDLPAARKLGAQPVARSDDWLEVVTRHGAALREIGAWAATRDLRARCYIVPEVRFEALLALVHGKPVPPRFASLLGRIVGRARARRLAEPHAPGAREVARPLVETGPLPRKPTRPEIEAENDLDITEDISDLHPVGPTTATASPVPVPVPAPSSPSVPPPVPSAPNGEPSVPALLAEWKSAATDEPRRKELARSLRRHRREPALEQALARWRAALQNGGGGTPEALLAVEALSELRDREAIPLLLDKLGDDSRLGQAVQAALRAITRHDFGGARWRWTRWWREHKERHRIEWLIDALTEKNAELRLEAAQELEELSGRYFGYHFDLGRREREEARRRWFDWWQSTGKATIG